MMERVWLPILLTLLAVGTAVGSIIRPSQTLSLAIGEGFIAYLELPKSFGDVKSCSFKYGDEAKITVDLSSTEPIVTDRDELVLPFAVSICGVRVSKLSALSAGVWTLEAEGVHGDVETDYTTIHTLPAQKAQFDTHVEREFGAGSIACTKHSTYTRHCKIIDDTGSQYNACELYTTIRENATFDCHIYNWGQMIESHEHIIVNIKNSTRYTTTSVEETANSAILRCQFVDKVSSCQAQMPDHKTEIFIMDGLYNGRYSSYDTLDSMFRCSLEIPKPLLSTEQGLWRIINYSTTTTPTGCLFYIGKNKTEIINNELKGLESRVEKLKAYKTDKTLSEVSCSVPFVIDDCYLSDPNGTVYFTDSIMFQRYRLYGRCVFSDMPVIAGIWTCGARGHDYEREVLQTIEVVVKPKEGEVLTKEIRVKRGADAVEFLCKSPYEEPLSHCAFIDPQKNVHLVGTMNSIKTAGHVQYFGRGLQHGECGIKITTVRTIDFGQWKCQFVFLSGNLNATFVMELKESGLAYATSIGLGIGLTIIILLVMGVVIGTVFYRRRNLTARHSFSPSIPLEGQTATMVTPTMEY